MRVQKKIIMDVEQMNDEELRALYAFIDSLKKTNFGLLRQGRTNR
jgi:hypothetical protein